MESLVRATQLVVAIALLNVWLLRTGGATQWRGGGAKSMREEFAVYGLPGWLMWVVGIIKVTLAVLLIVGLWLPSVVKPAATGIAVLMLAAVSMHVKVKDPLKKSMPALALLVLSVVVALL